MEQQQGVVPDPDAQYRLFDRVVNIRESFTVPLGVRGTIIGIKGGWDTMFVDFLRMMCRCTCITEHNKYDIFSWFIFCLSLRLQRSARQRCSTKCFLMKNLLEVSTSGTCTLLSTPDLLLSRHVTAVSLVLRCASPRGYRLPPCALINLSHGSRVDHTSHKLTAIVKPQPTTATSFNSQRQLGGLNHSPRSPFIPTQVRGEPNPALLLFDM